MIPADMRVVIVGLSPRVGSSLHACTTARQLLRGLGVDAALLSTVGLEIVPAGVDDHPIPAAVRSVLDAVANADAVVLGAPIHRSSLAGVSRNWIELMREGLAGKAVLPIVSAGSPRAQLAGESFRIDLWSNFSALPTRSVLVTPELGQEEMVVRLGDALFELLKTASAQLPVGASA